MKKLPAEQEADDIGSDNRRGGKGAGMQGDGEEEDLEQFMQEIEGDREMRRNINMYKKSGTKSAKMDARKFKLYYCYCT